MGFHQRYEAEPATELPTNAQQCARCAGYEVRAEASTQLQSSVGYVTTSWSPREFVLY